jgi:hypothetical protein
VSAQPVDLERGHAPLFVPAAWVAHPPQRDVALDLLRGLAMTILVVNHLRLESALTLATGALLSAAEVLVAVSGVVVGLVFGRRWRTDGPRRTTGMLLRRSRKLYLASVVVVALVGAATLLPGLATDALTLTPNGVPASDLYAFDGPLRTVLAIVTLEAGPWQFSILGFFIVSLAAAPALLWALARGWWPAIVLASLLLFVLGRLWPVDVLPTQSERPFPILVWQVLFVSGLVLGWHRQQIAAWLGRYRRWLVSAVALTAAISTAWLTFGPLALGPETWSAWEQQHFDKGSLDLPRIAAMMSMAGVAYLALGALAARAGSWPSRLLLALGRNSFYVFIVHVFLCLAVASALAPLGGSAGFLGNTAIQLGCLALLLAMVERRLLFRWVPR